MAPHPEPGPVGYERTVAFSDGVFAIAITLLVLGIEVPHVPGSDLAAAIRALGPSILSYFIGFAVVGLFWIGHHRFFNEVRAFDNRIVVLNLAYLSLIAVMPFTTGLLGNYGERPVAVALYAANVAATSLAEAAMTVLALRDGLLVATPRKRRGHLIMGLLVPLVFCVSIPIAYIDTDAAKWSWLSLAVIPPVLRRAGIVEWRRRG
jgi:TMEM175 potassium channel family protein